MSERLEMISKYLESLNLELQKYPQAKLIAVSKTKPASDIELAYRSGQRDFGENKVQELLDKSLELNDSCPDIRWHFIGHLQSNKINHLLKVKNLVSIHSIDSIKVLDKLISKDFDTNIFGNKIGLFLQINTSGEEEKGGFRSSAGISESIKSIQNSQGFHFQGFMTIGNIRTEEFETEAARCFEQLKDYQQQVLPAKAELSMGMSSDYQLALEHGSHWIRVGSMIFGGR